MIGETLTVSRGGTDNMGNRTTTSTHTIKGALSGGTWSRNRDERAESSKGTCELYCIKGVDLQQRDRITRATGQTYNVVSDVIWDGLHPMTGHDFGVVVYRLEAASG